MRNLLAILTAALLTAAAAGPPAPSSFTSRAEPASVGLGQPFAFVIEVTADPQVAYSVAHDLALGDYPVRKVTAERTPAGAEVRTTIRIETAVYDRLGAVTLPEVKLSARSPQGDGELAIPGPSLTVEAPASDGKLADPHPPVARRIPSYRVLWFAAGAVALLALVLLLRRYLRRLRQEHAEALAAPPGTPEDRALAALDALAGEALPRSGRAREHYFRLAEIARRYLDETGAPGATDMTSEELLAALRNRPPPGLGIPAFAAWLARGDLVRYAKLEPDEAAAARDLDEARLVVRAAGQARTRQEAAA